MVELQTAQAVVSGSNLAQLTSFVEPSMYWSATAPIYYIYIIILLLLYIYIISNPGAEFGCKKPTFMLKLSATKIAKLI